MAVATTTILIGAAIGAGVGAVATYAQGGRGDALWKGALVGAVGGAIAPGVGAWAGGGILGGAIGGAVGGVSAGVLGTALNGGNSSDYLKSGLFGGLTGAALGAAGGYANSGGEAAVNPVTGEAIPAGSPEITALPDADIATGTGVGQSSAPGVESSITGAPAAPSQGTTPSLQDTTNTLAGNQYAAANTGTLTDIGGSSPVPQELSGSYKAPSFLDSSFGSGNANLSGTTDFTGVGIGQGQVPTAAGNFASPNVGVDGIPLTSGGEYAFDDAVQSTGLGTKELANSPTFKAKEFGADLGFDTFGYGKTLGQGTNTGIGKGMGLEDYLKLQGKSQLIGGGIKTLGALATARETQQNRQDLMDLYNQQDEANQYYQNKLRQSYDNPMGYLGSGEAAATRSAALQKLVAQNAMAGRRTAGSALQNQLMMNQLQNLQAYRRGIPTPQYGQAAQTLNYAQQYSPTADIFGGLSSAVTPLSLYSLYGG